MMSNKLIILALVFVTCLPASQLYESVESHMGTLFRIKLYVDSEATAQAAFKSAFARVAQLDNILSDYKPDSELNTAAASAAVKPVHISSDLMRVLQASQDIAAESDGAFDVTVGQLTKLWRTARHNHQLPATEALLAAREKCDYRKLHLDLSAHTMKLDSAGIQLDVGGIAKGYAAEEALLVLFNLSIRRALVAASGDLALGDAPPGESGWKIGIDSLDRADKPFTRVMSLANVAVSTSGATEQYLDLDGKRYSHILNPKTGMGLETSLAVTTVSPRGATADAAALVVCVLGVEKGLAYVERHPELAAFIVDNNRSYASTRFNALKEVYASH